MAMPQRDNVIEKIKRLEPSLVCVLDWAGTDTVNQQDTQGPSP